MNPEAFIDLSDQRVKKFPYSRGHTHTTQALSSLDEHTQVGRSGVGGLWARLADLMEKSFTSLKLSLPLEMPELNYGFINPVSVIARTLMVLPSA